MSRFFLFVIGNNSSYDIQQYSGFQDFYIFSKYIIKEKLIVFTYERHKGFLCQTKKTMNKNAIYFYENIYHIFDRKCK